MDSTSLSRALRRPLTLLLLGTAMVLGLAGLTASIPVRYRAVATLAVTQSVTDTQLAQVLGLSYARIAAAERKVLFMPSGTAGLSSIAARVASDDGHLTPVDVKRFVSITDTTDIPPTSGLPYARADIRVLSVAATAPTPRLAAATANDFAAQFIAYRRLLITEMIDRARAKVLSMVPRDRRVAGRLSQGVTGIRLSQLENLLQAERELVYVYAPARLPHHRLSPYIVRDCLVGVLLTILGLFLASLLLSSQPPMIRWLTLGPRSRLLCSHVGSRWGTSSSSVKELIVRRRGDLANLLRTLGQHWRGLLASAVTIVALSLLAVSVYGLQHPIPLPPAFSTLSVPAGERSLVDRNLHESRRESEEQYFRRLTLAIHYRLAPDWNQFSDPVSLRENYLLSLLGHIYPTFATYEFAHAGPALRRGYGVCSQFSSVVLDLLHEQHFRARLLIFPAHTIVSAYTRAGRPFILDAYMGVVIPASATELALRPRLALRYYERLNVNDNPRTGLTSRQMAETMVANFAAPFKEIGEPRRALVETVAYFLKWAIPAALLTIALVLVFPWRPRGRRYDDPVSQRPRLSHQGGLPSQT